MYQQPSPPGPVHRRTVPGLWLAGIVIPLVAGAVQWQLWPYIQPFVWFLFYPAVFAAAWLDSRRGSAIAALLSIALVVYFFLPPQRSWQVDYGSAWFSIGIFFVMSLAFGETFARLHRAEAQRVEALARQHENVLGLERAQRAEIVRNEETRFRQIVEGLPQLVWTSTPAGPCDYLSQQWLDYTGVPLEQQLGSGWLEAVHPDDRQLLWQAWSSAVETGMAYRVEHRLRRADGEYRWYDTRAMPLRDAGGHIVHWFGASTDIQAARDAASLVERQARLLELAYDPIILWSEDRGIEFWNVGARELYGYTDAEVLGRNPHDLLQTVFPESLEATLAALETETVWTGELRHVTRDGAALIVKSRLQRLVLDGRTVVLEANRDITAERAQLEEVRRWADAFTYCAHGIAIGLPQSNKILACNPAFAQILGRPVEQVVGQPILSVYAPEDHALIRERIARADLSGQARYEAHVVGAGGQKIPVQVDVASVRNSADDVRYRVATIQDIRERRAAEAQVRALTVGLEQQVADRTAELRAANAELESFAYAVSHDLRAPLRAMSGFSTALVEDYGDKLGGDARVYLDQIVVGARQMSELIDGLLVLSRSTRGDLMQEWVDVSAIAASAWARIRQADHAEPPRDVEFELEAGLNCRGDPRMLAVVIANLLENAWKYTARASGARVRMGAVAGAPGTFFVEDNGAGFDMAHAGKLFQPFQRLHRQEEFAGIGIGLATVQRIVRRHGGEIRAEGEVGKGARFTFSLPAATGGTDA